jgi:hypothetical protein
MAIKAITTHLHHAENPSQKLSRIGEMNKPRSFRGGDVGRLEIERLGDFGRPFGAAIFIRSTPCPPEPRGIRNFDFEAGC